MYASLSLLITIEMDGITLDSDGRLATILNKAEQLVTLKLTAQ